MATLTSLRKEQALCCHQHLEEDGWLPEDDEEINDRSRAIIQAAKEEWGQVWLGRINLYPPDRQEPVMWQWDGSMVYNFGAGFALPCHDNELVILILERDRAEYTGTTDDARRLDVIHRRIQSLGGIILSWS